MQKQDSLKAKKKTKQTKKPEANELQSYFYCGKLAKIIWILVELVQF